MTKTDHVEGSVEKPDPIGIYLPSGLLLSFLEDIRI